MELGTGWCVRLKIGKKVICCTTTNACRQLGLATGRMAYAIQSPYRRMSFSAQSLLTCMIEGRIVMLAMPRYVSIYFMQCTSRRSIRTYARTPHVFSVIHVVPDAFHFCALNLARPRLLDVDWIFFRFKRPLGVVSLLIPYKYVCGPFTQ